MRSKGRRQAAVTPQWKYVPYCCPRPWNPTCEPLPANASGDHQQTDFENYNPGALTSCMRSGSLNESATTRNSTNLHSSLHPIVPRGRSPTGMRRLLTRYRSRGLLQAARVAIVALTGSVGGGRDLRSVLVISSGAYRLAEGSTMHRCGARHVLCDRFRCDKFVSHSNSRGRCFGIIWGGSIVITSEPS